MSFNKPIHRIAIVGTGVIGASWAAQYLARGFDVVATDPAPNAEANLRKYVDEAWGQLEAIGLSTGATRDRLTFTPDMKAALAQADLVQENAPERPEFKIKLFADRDHAECHAVEVQAPRACPRRAPIQPAAHRPARGSRRRSQDGAGSNQTGHGVLRVDREEADSIAEGTSGPCGQPPASGALSRNALPHRARRVERGRHGYCGFLRTGTPLGRHGSEPAVASRRRRRRHQALHGSPDVAAGRHDESPRHAKHHAAPEA